MARFFVGQRVRVVGCDFPEDAALVIGAEGIVNELDCVSEAGDYGVVGVTLPFGSPSSDEYEGFRADEWTFHPYELEPILPDGHRAGDFTNVHDLLESLTKEVA